ncbi:MAG: histidine ammonia-lyase, partial [Solirubrobacteraceae bacterium]|nr:histidine ammonia-lyase [Solirubrobacteraceae bacterium]
MIELGSGGLQRREVVAVARAAEPVTLGASAREAMDASAAVVAGLVDAEPASYGISTGFGSLALVRIPAESRGVLQRALVRSHAAGMGPSIEREVVRAMMLLRARSLAMGFSGARPVLAQRMLELLNHDLIPRVPEHGSLGASGDLAPLAHCALALIGEGELETREGELRPAAEAMAAVGLDPVELAAKEGLALINGTDGMLG